MTLSIRPHASDFAADAMGIDLALPLDDATYHAWKLAFEKYRVLVLHGQHFDDDRHVAFSKRFGPLEEFPEEEMCARGHNTNQRDSNVHRDTGEFLTMKDAAYASFVLGTSEWHIDSSYRKMPSRCSFLLAREVPASGGDTMFANMAMAYAALPEAKKVELEGVYAIHEFGAMAQKKGAPAKTPEVRAKNPPVRHPLVQRLPNGERALFLGSHIDTLEGMDDARAQALIAEMTEWATRPQFTYRHQWKVGDMVMWDNLATMHRGMPYERANDRRVLQRTTVAGDWAIAA